MFLKIRLKDGSLLEFNHALYSREMDQSTPVLVIRHETPVREEKDAEGKVVVLWKFLAIIQEWVYFTIDENK